MSIVKSKRKTALISIVILAGVLIAIRAYLPIWVKDYVNQQIAELDGYSGGIEDVDLHLWRGAYEIFGLNIVKTETGIDKPFVAAEAVDLSVQWAALFDGAIVAELDIYDADLNFSKTQTGEGAGWVNFIDALSPIDINRLDVHSGRMSYTDYGAEPNVHLFIDNIAANIVNLRHVRDGGARLPSGVDIAGTSIGAGALSLTGKMNILKPVPDFDFAVELENADLTAFNDYANDFANIDFDQGTIGVFGELAAADGKATGYIKPIATKVSVVSLDQDTNPLDLIWESLAGLFIELFENQSKDQFAMRIPLEGDLSDPDQDLWSGFLSIFKNAFGTAFSRNEDGTINFQDAIEQS